MAMAIMTIRAIVAVMAMMAMAMFNTNMALIGIP